jgi:hypothetical protein
MTYVNAVFTSIFIMIGIVACGDDSNGGSEAVQYGVGAQCSKDTDCRTEGTTCLTQFKGGYCGVAGCESDVDCPEGSACVAHEDGRAYCFLTCVDKVDCNVSRGLEVESNCSSNVVFVDDTTAKKACVPPSGS